MKNERAECMRTISEEDKVSTCVCKNFFFLCHFVLY